MLKWATELSQFDICYSPRTTIKGQALADFIAEFTYSNITEVAGIANGFEAAKEVEIERNEIAAMMSEDSHLHRKQ